MSATEQEIRDRQAVAAQEERAERQRRAMTQIRQIGDPVLRERAHEVTTFDDGLRALSERMVQIMRDAPGIGLAAPQIGVVRRVLVYQVEHDGQASTLVNPVIVSASEETETLDEGCLSVGVTMPVERPLEVRVRAHDVTGVQREFDAAELEARVIQHELDHLDGVLIVDRTTREDRARALRELRERSETPGAMAPAGGL